MELAELIDQICDFDAVVPRRKICLFGWFLHAYRNADTFDNAAIRECFRKLGLPMPDVTVYLPRMADSKPPDLIRQRGAYKLERSVRQALEAEYGRPQSVVTVSRLLADLPAKVPDHAESVFLMETLSCYRAQAYRAAIVMAWNLAFTHLLRWTLVEAQRLSSFNKAIPLRFPKKPPIVISRIEDFEELKESEVIEVYGTADLLSKNIVEILREKLKRRNRAAHPSQVKVEQHQADDTISDLVSNVVLALT